ncbi:hypothetical protein [Deinococcus sp.]|uniref:hypothetical protein n=1 Tax=Deinococcus sp. TaxID=47478 RepID=UPI0025C285BE|nr:hypothetical protein [Deinococcus sp.]
MALRLGLDAQGSDLSVGAYHQGVASRLRARGAQVQLGLDASAPGWPGHFRAADLVVAHPAYGTQLAYHAGPGDMSAAGDDDAFLEQLHALTLNMREVTATGGHYVVIIGDTRKNGRYHSYQGDLLARMPRTELRSVTVKAQHNTTSARQAYGRIQWDAIDHEYVLVWRREGTVYAALGACVRQARAAQASSWKHVVRAAMHRLGRAPLREIYEEVARDAPEKVRANEHYQAKVRQVLQSLPDMQADGRGVWRCAAA